jgi:hypothetical protein
MAKEFIAKGIYGIPDGPTSQISEGARKAMERNDPDAYNTLIRYEKAHEAGEDPLITPRKEEKDQALYTVKEVGDGIVLTPTRHLLAESKAPARPVQGEQKEKSVTAAPATTVSKPKAAPAPAKKKPAAKATPATKPTQPVSAVNTEVVVAEGSGDKPALANDPTVIP